MPNRIILFVKKNLTFNPGKHFSPNQPSHTPINLLKKIKYVFTLSQSRIKDFLNISQDDVPWLCKDVHERRGRPPGRRDEQGRADPSLEGLVADEGVARTVAEGRQCGRVQE